MQNFPFVFVLYTINLTFHVIQSLSFICLYVNICLMFISIIMCVIFVRIFIFLSVHSLYFLIIFALYIFNSLILKLIS